MSTACLTHYGHADAVALLLRGYHSNPMADRPDPNDTATLRVEQDQRAADEATQARESAAPDEARAHRRRADKAAYLRDKLAEAERSGDR